MQCRVVQLQWFCLAWSVVGAGCATIPPVGDEANALAKPERSPEQIHWPERYQPKDATFYIHNEIEIAAPPEVVWDILVRAEAWPQWYEGAKNVKVPTPTRKLEAGAAFSWTTMGLDFTSTIKEWAPPHRLSWESRKAAIKGYHAWLIVPTRTGCRVITDEAQHGFLAAMQKVFIPNKLRRLHDVWLAETKKKAEAAHALAEAKTP